MNVQFKHYRAERRLERQGEEFFYRKKYMVFKVAIKTVIITNQLVLFELSR